MTVELNYYEEKTKQLGFASVSSHFKLTTRKCYRKKIANYGKEPVFEL